MGYKYLNFVELLSLSNWNIKYITYSGNKNTTFDIVEIKKVITRNKTNVLVRNGESYKRITIKTNGGGVSVRDTEVGERIKTKKQYIVSDGQLVISKIDARNGAFGIVPKEANGAIITGNFWAYDVDYRKANIKYLLFILSSNSFVEKWFVCSNGSGNRLYLQEELFLNTKIPLPTLKEQKRIVSEYENKISVANEMKKQSNFLKASIDDVLFDELGIEMIKSKEKIDTKYLKIIHFNSLVKWGAELNSANISPVNMLKSKKYDNKPLGLIAKVNPTTDFSNLNKSDEITFLPMECVSDIYGEVLEKRKTTVQNAKGYTKFQENDIIWAKITPCMQNGKSAIVTGLVNLVGCGSTEYHVIRTDYKILNSYVYLILRTNLVRQVATSYFSGSAGQQRVGADYLENLNIPVPPLDIQNAIVEKISKIKDEIKELNNKSAEIISTAQKNFEEEIFGE